MKPIVTIDGIDGSGKSTFARTLAAGLATQGLRALIVSIDDFRRPVAWGALTEPELDVYYDRYYDLAMAERALRAFQAGEHGMTIPSYDSISEQIIGTRELAFAAADIAVVEGVFPLRVPAVDTGVFVFLEVSPEEARRRIVTRDMKKNRTREETERRIARRYFPAQERYWAAFAPRERADVILGNDDPANPQVRKRELDRAPTGLREVLERVLPR